MKYIVRYKDYVYVDLKELRKIENRFLHAKKRRVKNKYKNMLRKVYPSGTNYWWSTIASKQISSNHYVLGVDLARYF